MSLFRTISEILVLWERTWMPVDSFAL